MIKTWQEHNKNRITTWLELDRWYKKGFTIINWRCFQWNISTFNVWTVWSSWYALCGKITHRTVPLLYRYVSRIFPFISFFSKWLNIFQVFRLQMITTYNEHELRDDFPSLGENHDSPNLGEYHELQDDPQELWRVSWVRGWFSKPWRVSLF